MRGSVALVIHDVAPATYVPCRRLVESIESVAGTVPLTLLIVPHYHAGTRMDHDPAWRRWIDGRAAMGDELVLHGYFHCDDGPAAKTPGEWFARRVLTDGEAEFAALHTAAARRRIESGQRLFAACGWQTDGFVPPAWQLSAAARAVLREAMFAYTTTRTQVLHLGSQSAWYAPALSLSARSMLRRRCSQLFADRWSAPCRSEPFVRLALHPADARYPELMKTWQQVLQRMLVDRTVVTKRQWVQQQGVQPQAGLRAVAAT